MGVVTRAWGTHPTVVTGSPKEVGGDSRNSLVVGVGLEWE